MLKIFVVQEKSKDVLKASEGVLLDKVDPKKASFVHFLNGNILDTVNNILDTCYNVKINHVYLSEKEKENTKGFRSSQYAISGSTNINESVTDLSFLEDVFGMGLGHYFTFKGIPSQTLIKKYSIFSPFIKDISLILNPEEYNGITSHLQNADDPINEVVEYDGKYFHVEYKPFKFSNIQTRLVLNPMDEAFFLSLRLKQIEHNSNQFCGISDSFMKMEEELIQEKEFKFLTHVLTKYCNLVPLKYELNGNKT